MGQKPKSAEETAQELRELLSEARGMVKDLTRLLDQAKQVIPTLVLDKIMEEMKGILDRHQTTMYEITGAWDKAVDDKFADLAVSMAAMIERYAISQPMQDLGIPEDKKLVLGTIVSTVNTLAFADANKAVKDERAKRKL